MNLEQVKKKFHDDRDTFLKGRTRYASSFPYEFADYMTKYADPLVLKKWEEEQGIREKPQGKKKSLSFYAIQYGGVPMTPDGEKRFLRMALADGYTHDEIRSYLGLSKRQSHEERQIKILKSCDSEMWIHCKQNRDKILGEIEKEMTVLQSGCEQEVCPMSNLNKGKYDALRKLKEFIEGLQW